MNSYRIEATLILTGSGARIVETLGVNLADGMDPVHTAEAQLVDLGYTETEIEAASFETVKVDGLS
jgi:hypothetical protein